MLVDTEILLEISRKGIIIKPFNLNKLGSNSYDVHLGPRLAQYKDKCLDVKKDNAVEYFDIPESGYMLLPGRLYLGSTIEYTEFHTCIPMLEGKSSGGRLGISIHVTAGVGDIGFRGHWTLEITVVIPVIIYKEMPIGQLLFHSVRGIPRTPYNKKDTAKYDKQGPLPAASKMYLNYKK